MKVTRRLVNSSLTHAPRTALTGLAAALGFACKSESLRPRLVPAANHKAGIPKWRIGLFLPVPVQSRPLEAAGDIAPCRNAELILRF